MAAKKVIVLGGGVAGLTAAHELAERGFAVTVYERDHLGGKAWSVGVPGSAAGNRDPLPAEHGFRFFPGFYQNLGDTQRRIPLPGGGSVYDRLVEATTYRSSFAGRPDLTVPLTPGASRHVDLSTVGETLLASVGELTRLPPHELAYFVDKLGVYVSSCDERRLGQWEHVAWKDFIREDEMSEEYRKVASRSLVRNLAATKSSEASTHSIGLVGEASVMSILGRGNDQDATFDRVLDGPTSEAWLDHWVALLRKMGVTFRVGWTAKALQMTGGRVSGARVRDRQGITRTVAADWFVCATPLERTARLLSADVLAADPRLEGIRRLRNDWMAGLVFYLRRPLPLAHGHVNYVDSPFALTSISQAQFWRRPLGEYGDGTVRESLSTIVSDWETPGIVCGKAARDCTPEEVARDAWAQLKAHLDDQGVLLRDEDLHSWFLDPAMKPAAGGGLDNDTPLFIQNPGSWDDRPDSRTAIPNLALAGDWVRTKINVTTMDGANQGGRQAANAVLEAAGSRAEPAAVHGLYVAPEFEGFKRIDRARWQAGQPNLFDPDQARPPRSAQVSRPARPAPSRGRP
jgi:uncharacterized protein with NAD-binding domain and iron-sulfur cluster